MKPGKNEKEMEKINYNSFSEIINDLSKDIQSEVEQAENILPKNITLDYGKIKEENEIMANNIVDKIINFYLDETIINNVPYVENKSQVDKITVSSLLFQMKTAEHAIIKLLEQIDNGNVIPRTFEVLAALQKSKMEIVKHMAQFMVIMENNYKSIKDDWRIKNEETKLLLNTKESESYEIIEEDEEDEIENDTIHRGTKNLIDILRKEIPEIKPGQREFDPENDPILKK
jgi:hypothetical protein